MTSSFKGQTENTPPLLSGASTAESGLLSELSARTDNTATNTPTTPKPSSPILPAATTDYDNKTVLSALMFKAAISRLEKSGLIRRYKVLSKDRTTVKEIQIVLDPAVWTTDLELKSVVASPDNTRTTTKEPQK